MDSSRLRTGELVAGIGGIALFVFLFFDWFGASGGFGGSIDGWDGLGSDFTGFIVALTSVSGAALALLAISGQRVNIPVPRGGITALLGSLSVAIILWRFFANPGDLKIGIFLGLAAAVAIAAGAIMALREDGVEPLVAVPGGRTRASSATAPTAEVPAATAAPAAKRAARKSPARKSPARKSAARKSAARKSPARKSRARKASARKRPARKSSATRKQS